jgi:hypothetical protein
MRKLESLWWWVDDSRSCWALSLHEFSASSFSRSDIFYKRYVVDGPRISLSNSKRKIAYGFGNLHFHFSFTTKPNVRYGHYGLHCASVEEAYFNIPICPSLCYEMLIRPEAKTALNMQPLTTPIVSFFYLDSLDVRCLCSGSMNTSLRLVSTC